MNERIMEYAKEARLYAQGIYPEVNDIKEWGQVYHEKFAELIVKECMEWCDAHATIDGSAQQIRNSIKNHFGVEE